MAKKNKLTESDRIKEIQDMYEEKLARVKTNANKENEILKLRVKELAKQLMD